jgi:hypothetical protein
LLFAQCDATLVKLSFLSIAEEIQIRAFTVSNDEQLDYRFTYQDIEKELIQVNQGPVPLFKGAYLKLLTKRQAFVSLATSGSIG